MVITVGELGSAEMTGDVRGVAREVERAERAGAHPAHTPLVRRHVPAHDGRSVGFADVGDGSPSASTTCAFGGRAAGI